jgi:hypothetical protein
MHADAAQHREHRGVPGLSDHSREQKRRYEPDLVVAKAPPLARTRGLS